MKVIKPVVITDSMLVSSTVPEADYAPYVAATDYVVGQHVIFDHVIYECVQTPNIGHAPDSSPLYWAPQGPTNRWLMFDQEVSTQTIGASPLTVVITPGIVNSLALLELEGTAISVEVKDGAAGPVVFSHTQALEMSTITDWYEYFFEPFDRLREIVITELPPYGSAYITVSITGGTVECGSLILGTLYELGDAEFGASAGIIDYSRKETSATGVTTFQRRKYSKRTSLRLLLPKANFNKVHRLLASLRATPCVWIGADDPDYGPLTMLGFYRDFSMDVAYPTVSYCNLEIEGLT